MYCSIVIHGQLLFKKAFIPPPIEVGVFCQNYDKLVRRTIYLPTGKTNKGGHMIWEEKETIVSDSTASIRGYAKIKYPTKNFQIRQY